MEDENRILRPGDMPLSLPPCLRSRGSLWLADVENDDHVDLHRIEEVLFDKTSEFQHIQLLRTAEFGRTLVLDNLIQVGESDEFIYHDMLIHPGIVMSKAKSVMVLGGGDGCAVREILRWRQVKRVVLVEIDPVMMELFQDRFPEWTNGSLRDNRVEIRCEDAFKVAKEDETFDLIIGDFTEPYDEGGLGGELSKRAFSPEFYEAIKKKLTKNGVYVAQTGGVSCTGSDEYHVEIVRGMKESFGQTMTAYEYVPSFDSMWTVTFASVEKLPEINPSKVDWALRYSGIECRYYSGSTHARLFASFPFVSY